MLIEQIYKSIAWGLFGGFAAHQIMEIYNIKRNTFFYNICLISLGICGVIRGYTGADLTTNFCEYYLI